MIDQQPNATGGFGVDNVLIARMHLTQMSMIHLLGIVISEVSGTEAEMMKILNLGDGQFLVEHPTRRIDTCTWRLCLNAFCRRSQQSKIKESLV